MHIPQPWSATAYVHVYMYVLRAGGQSGSSALEPFSSFGAGIGGITVGRLLERASATEGGVQCQYCISASINRTVKLGCCPGRISGQF